MTRFHGRILAWAVAGTITTSRIQLSLSINFTGGGSAAGTITINKQ